MGSSVVLLNNGSIPEQILKKLYIYIKFRSLAFSKGRKSVMLIGIFTGNKENVTSAQMYKLM